MSYNSESHTINENYHLENKLWSVVKTVFQGKYRYIYSYKFYFIKNKCKTFIVFKHHLDACIPASVPYGIRNKLTSNFKL